MLWPCNKFMINPVDLGAREVSCLKGSKLKKYYHCRQFLKKEKRHLGSEIFLILKKVSDMCTPNRYKVSLYDGLLQRGKFEKSCSFVDILWKYRVQTKDLVCQILAATTYLPFLCPQSLKACWKCWFSSFSRRMVHVVFFREWERSGSDSQDPARKGFDLCDQSGRQDI